jgi:hypothetical protein
MTKYIQGHYKLRHPEKYIGDINRVVYRSSWELQLDQFLDNNIKVLKWGAEVVTIPYLKPTDNRMHKYIVDFYVEFINSANEVKYMLLEVKPQQQTKPPKATHKNCLYEQAVYAINMCKWRAAEQWCKMQSIKYGKKVEFKILTETSIFK